MTKIKKIMSTGFIFLCSALIFAQNFTASKAAYIKGHTDSDFSANQNGVFPVKLTWEDSFSRYVISFASSDSDSFVKIADLKAGTSEFVHNNPDAVPEQTFTYKIECYNASDKLVSEQTDSGWGALTAKQFLTTYTTRLDKTQKRLTLMNKKSILDKIGNEEIDGIMSGKLTYTTKIVGFSGLVTISYINYQDFDNWHFDGSVQTKSNIAANGTMKGSMNCTGIYDAQIDYDHALLKNAAPGGGYYTVTRKGFPAEDVPHKYYVVIEVPEEASAQ